VTDPLSRARALLACAGDPGVYSTVPVSIDTLALLCDELERAREVVEAARGTLDPYEHPDDLRYATDRTVAHTLARYDAARRGDAFSAFPHYGGR
jgi:hypothetical protein